MTIVYLSVWADIELNCNNKGYINGELFLAKASKLNKSWCNDIFKEDCQNDKQAQEILPSASPMNYL